MLSNTLLDLFEKLKENNIFLTLIENDKLKINAPKGAMTSDIMGQLKENKEQIIGYLKQSESMLVENSFPQKGGSAGSREVLTPMQRSLWLAHEFDPNASAYNIPIFFELFGELNVELLTRCLKAVVSRHSILRTNFSNENGVPYQFVTESNWDVEIVETNKSQLTAILKQEMERQFDLENSQLFCCKIVKIAENHHMLLMNMHHIVSDGWSCSVLFKEMELLYSNQGNTDVLPELPFQYKDYSFWYEKEFAQNNIKRQEFFWKRYLDGAPTLLNYPTDRPRPARISSKGQVLEFEINEQMTEKVRQYCREKKCTLYQFFVSVYQIILHRFSSEKDIVLGTAAANRSFQELEPLIGYFVNVLPLRAQLEEDLTFEGLLESNITNIGQVLAHQELSLEHIIDIVSPERSLSHTPIFQNALQFHSKSQTSLRLGDVDSQLISIETSQLDPALQLSVFAKFDLELNMFEREDTLFCSLRYNTDLYSRSGAQRQVDSFLLLTQQVVNDPTRLLRNYELLTQETKQLLFSFNQPNTDLSADIGIHHLFEQIAAKQPTRTALSFNDDTLTFEMLNKQANQLAHLLIQKGVGTGSLVGICINRSTDMVISLLATMKSGAAYVPLDPSYPMDRIHFTVEDAKPDYIITQEAVAEYLPESFSEKLVCINASNVQQQIALNSVENLPSPMQTGQLAYVIYTSGSTGKPKGVQITHRSVINLFRGFDEYLSAEIQDEQPSVWLALASIAFDISVLEIFWTMCSGHKVVIQGESPREFQSIEPISLNLTVPVYEWVNSEKYEQLIKIAQLAEELGVKAISFEDRVSTSEHFNRIAPLLGAAVAGSTRHIKLRTTAFSTNGNYQNQNDEWSVVNSLSGGRVETMISSFSGEKYQSAWVDAGDDPQLFAYAGSIGAGVYTDLMLQDKEELEVSIRIYKRSLVDNGFESHQSRVSVMLHCFFAELTPAAVDEALSALKAFINCKKEFKQTFVKRNKSLSGLSDVEITQKICERYIAVSGLFGSVQHCAERVVDLADLGVTDVCCAMTVNSDSALYKEQLLQLANLQKFIKRRAAQNASLKARNELYVPIAENIRKHSVKRMQCTPSLLADWLKSSEGVEAFKQLDLLFVGGEALEQSLADTISSYMSGKAYNVYGPTETTVWSAIAPIVEGQVKVGGPIKNTQFYVLDKDLNMVNIGVPGELYIGGAGLSAGYLGREELTAERFISNPFAGELGLSLEDRVYCTGDVVSWRDDGTLQFINRADNQIKIRGHRVELGEIEQVLNSSPLVSKTVAKLHTSENNGQQFIATYIVAHDNEFLSNDEILKEVQVIARENLPYYMIPEQWQIIPEMPLTPNGKIDRNALKPKEGSLPTDNKIAPISDVEKQLSVIWEDLLSLGRNTIGLHDNFFKIGGNSLLVMQLVSRVKQTFSVILSTKDTFESPTVELLALKIEKGQSVTIKPLVALPRSTKLDGVPATYLQKLFWYIQNSPGKLKNSTSVNITQALQLNGNINAEYLRVSAQHVLDSHESLRSTFSIKNLANILLHIQLGLEIDWKQEDISGFREPIKQEKIQASISEERLTEFDLTKGPLIRCRLLNISPESQVFIITVHHISSDLWSLNIIKKELFENYKALTEKRGLPSRQRNIHYSDYAHWLSLCHETEQHKRQLEYWNQKISTLKNLVRFPTDHNVSLQTQGIAKDVELPITEELLSSIEKLCEDRGVTLYIAMVAIVGLSLYHYSGLSRQVVSSYIAGRSRSELDNSVGQFADNIFIVTEIDEGDTFCNFIRKTRDWVYEAQDNSDVSPIYLRQKTGEYVPTLPVVLNFVELNNSFGWRFPGTKIEMLNDEPTDVYTTIGLDINVRWTENGFRSLITYNTELFNESSALFFQRSIVKLLNQLNTKPDSRIFEVIPKSEIYKNI